MSLKSTFSFFTKLLSLFLVISLFSCEEDELDFSEPRAEETQATEAMENFRRKVENSYTIANMQMALDSIMY